MKFDFANDVNLGDWVMYVDHVGSPRPHPALVVHKGDDSLELLVYVYSELTCTPRYRSGVRHVADPRLADPVFMNAIMAEGDSGFFDLHPDKVALKSALERIEELEEKVFNAKKAKPVKVVDKPAPPAPDTSFRLEEIGKAPLTEEEKAARRELLKSAV